MSVAIVPFLPAATLHEIILLFVLSIFSFFFYFHFLLWWSFLHFSNWLSFGVVVLVVFASSLHFISCRIVFDEEIPNMLRVYHPSEKKQHKYNNAAIRTSWPLAFIFNSWSNLLLFVLFYLFLVFLLLISECEYLMLVVRSLYY